MMKHVESNSEKNEAAHLHHCMEYAKLEHFPQLVVLRFMQKPLQVRQCKQSIAVQ